MSGETTTSTVTGWLHASQLSMGTAPYAIDPNCAMLHIRTEPTPKGTAVHAFSRETKDTALSGNITEATGLSNTAWDTAQVTATTAEWGIMRQLTKKSERQNIYGPEGLQFRMVTDGTAMCLERWETLVWAEFANASTSVGTSGQALTLADIGSAFAQATVNKIDASLVFMLSATQGKNIRNEALASGAAFLSNGSGAGILRQTQAGGFMGNLLGADFFTNNLAASASADKVGVAMVDAGPGSGNDPVKGATAGSIAWMPEAYMLGQPAFSGGAQIAITMCGGLVEVIDYAYVKLVTIA